MNSTDHILMIRPHNFSFNSQTAKDNIYQNESAEGENTSKLARQQFDEAVETLRDNQVKVEVLEDNFLPKTPDSIFPNNWFSSHGKTLVLYPMLAENRRKEVEKFYYQLNEIIMPNKLIDLRLYARLGEHLEGTGSMVLDRENKLAYASISERTDEDLFEIFCRKLHYKPVAFRAYQDGLPVYHTNVLMTITSDFAMISPELIDRADRKRVLDSLSNHHEIIELRPEQIKSFAANCLEVYTGEKLLIMSETAYRSLDDQQVEKIEEKMKIVRVDVSEIERVGGGSIRCMMAELFD